MRIPSGINLADWLRMGLLILSISACTGAREAPSTYVVLVTRVVPVTQIIPKKVTQVVRVTQIMRVLEPTALPATVAPATKAPLAATASVPPTEAPAVPVLTETPLPATNDVLVWYDFEGDFRDSGVVPDRSGHGQDAHLVGSVETRNGISGGQAIYCHICWPNLWR